MTIRSYMRSASLLIALFACAMSASAQNVELKIASVAPDGSGWMRAMRAGAQRISQATDERVVIKFYPGGVMGDDAQILRRIRIGQLHGGAFTAGGLSARYPALNLYGIPLLFRSLDEVDHIRTALDAELMSGLEEAGFVSFGFIEGGFAQLMSNEPAQSVEDLRRRKVWIPDGDQISQMAMQAVGISPVALPVTDVMTALQTGLLDVVASSPVVALVLQWHTKVRFVTDLPIAYSMGIFAIDARSFSKVSTGDQEIVRNVMTEVVTSLDAAARDDNEKALQAMFDTGIKAVPVDANNVEEWRALVEAIYPRLSGREDVDSAMLTRVLTYLAQYRTGASQASLSP